MARLLGPLFVVLWSSGFLAAGVGTRDVPGLSLTTARLLLAGVLFVGVALLTRAPWPRGRRAWAHLLRTGVLLHAVQFGCGYTAIGLGVPAGLAALVLCLSPVLVAVLAGPVLGERLGRRGAVGSAVAVLGTVIAGFDHLDDGGTPIGLVLLGLGLGGFAAGTLCQKRSGASMDLCTGSAVQVLAAFAALAPVTVVVDGALVLPHTAAGTGALLWLAVVNSGAAALLLFVLLRRGSATSVSGLLHVVPAVTAVLAVPVLGQPLSVQTIVGLGVTLVGVVLVQRATHPDPVPVPQAPPGGSPLPGR